MRCKGQKQCLENFLRSHWTPAYVSGFGVLTKAEAVERGFKDVDQELDEVFQRKGRSDAPKWVPPRLGAGRRQCRIGPELQTKKAAAA